MYNFSKIIHWYRENKRLANDLLIISLLGGFSAAILFYIDAAERFFAFSRHHESWELDETVIIGSIVGSVCLAVFSYRRWKDVTRLLVQVNTDPLPACSIVAKDGTSSKRRSSVSIRYSRSLALIIFDLDHFKHVNDTFGHLASDRALKAVAKSVTIHIRQPDSFIRWGGEEFIIVCPETGQADARTLAERLRLEILGMTVPGLPPVTASFGIGQLRQKDDFFAFLKRVDDNLLKTKAAGRNRVIGESH
jgi:diguanylate cyclase (GGDEF)-like protein